MRGSLPTESRNALGCPAESRSLFRYYCLALTSDSRVDEHVHRAGVGDVPRTAGVPLPAADQSRRHNLEAAEQRGDFAVRTQVDLVGAAAFLDHIRGHGQ